MAVTPSTTSKGTSVVYHARVEIWGITWKEIEKWQTHVCLGRHSRATGRQPLMLSLIPTIIQLASCTAAMERCRSTQLTLLLPLSLASGFLEKSLERQRHVTEKSTRSFRPAQLLILQTTKLREGTVQGRPKAVTSTCTWIAAVPSGKR